MTEAGELVVESGLSSNDILRIAALLEKGSEHPIGKAIVREATEKKLGLNLKVEGFRAYPGKGVEGKIQWPVAGGRSSLVLVGNRKFMLEKGLQIPDVLLNIEEKLCSEGNTVVFISTGHRPPATGHCISGLIAISDKIRPESKRCSCSPQKMGLRVSILTGDNQKTAAAVANAVGADGFIAESCRQTRRA